MSFSLQHCQISVLIFGNQEREDDPNIRGDAFKTLFIARLSYDTTEKDLEREFGRFGPIERVSQEHSAQILVLTDWEQIRIVTDSMEGVKMENGAKPKKKMTHRGYAFVVFEREKDMKGTVFQSLGRVAMLHDVVVSAFPLEVCILD